MTDDILIEQNNDFITVSTIEDNYNINTSSTEIVVCDHNNDTIEVEVTEDFINVELDATINYHTLEFKWTDPPETRNSPGTPGEMSFNDDNVFLCYAPNQWAKWLIIKGW